jgi:hypothetical protein
MDMDPKQFYQKLSELTYWEFPGHGRSPKTTNVKQTSKVRAIKERRVSRYRDPLELYPELEQGWVPPEIEQEEDLDEELEDTKPKKSGQITEDRVNLTVCPRIIALKNTQTTCEDCGDCVESRRIEHQKILHPKPHWRKWCSGCNLYLNPLTMTYNLPSQYALSKIISNPDNPDAE